MKKMLADGKNVVMNGVVEGVKMNSQNTCATVALKVEEYDKEAKQVVENTYEVDFWNSKLDSGKEINLADRIDKAGVKEGSHISVKAYQKEDGSLNGNNFGYGKLTYHTQDKEGNDITNSIVSGYANNVELKDTKAGKVCSFVVNTGSKEKPEWNNVTIFNSESQPNKAENAFKALKPYNVTVDGDKKTIAKVATFYCGKDTHNGLVEGETFRFGKKQGQTITKEDVANTHTFSAIAFEISKKAQAPEVQMAEAKEEYDAGFEAVSEEQAAAMPWDINEDDIENANTDDMEV